MESLLNFEEIAVFFSIVGGLCLVQMVRVRKSQRWEESAGLKRSLLAALGLLLQLPVILVVAVKPPYVTTAFSVEGFNLQRLVVGYLVQGLGFIGVGLLAWWLRG
jgi:hypothetical protein